MAYFFAWSEQVLQSNPPTLPIEPALVIKFITDHVSGLDVEVDKNLVAMKIKAKLGTHSITTVSRRVTAISLFHKLKRLEPNPCTTLEVSQLLSKARKRAVKNGYKPNKKTAATLERLNAMLATCDDSLSGIRTKAMLYFAFSSGGRRASELSEADIENLEAVGSDFTYTITHSKTDQEGHGFVVPICGLAADVLRVWLKKAAITEGSIFRGVDRHGRISDGITPTSITRIVKKHAALAGLDPKEFSSHSMRSGFMTQGARNNIALGDLMNLSGHKTVSVAMGYFEAGAVLNNPASKIAG